MWNGILKRMLRLGTTSLQLVESGFLSLKVHLGQTGFLRCLRVWNIARITQFPRRLAFKKGLVRRQLIQAVSLYIPVQNKAKDKGCNNGGPQSRPDYNREHLLIQHVGSRSHLRNQVCKLGSADHCPANHPSSLSHEGSTQHFCHDAGDHTHDATFP